MLRGLFSGFDVWFSRRFLKQEPHYIDGKLYWRTIK